MNLDIAVSNNPSGSKCHFDPECVVNAASRIPFPGDGVVQMGRYAMTTDSITPQGLREASQGMGYVTDPQTGAIIRGTGVIGSAFEAVGYVMHSLESGIAGGIEMATGSKTAGEQIAPVAMLFVPGAVTNVAKAAASVARTGRFANPATMSFFEAEAAANAAANASKISHTQVLSNVPYMPAQPKAVSFANNAKVTSSAPAMEVTSTLKVSQTGPSISAQVSTSTTPSLFGKAESYSGAQGTFGNNVRLAAPQQATWGTVAREAAERSTVSRAGYTTSTTSYGPMSNNAAFARSASSIEVTTTLKVGGNPGKISHNPLDNVTKISHSEVSISVRVGSYSGAQSTLASKVKLSATEQAALEQTILDQHLAAAQARTAMERANAMESGAAGRSALEADLRALQERAILEKTSVSAQERASLDFLGSREASTGSWLSENTVTFEAKLPGGGIQANKAYQRSDLIDPMRIDPETGLTSLERMIQGKAPIGPDGKAMHLHHMTQETNSPLAEMTEKFHQDYFREIHIWTNGSTGGVNRANPRPKVNRKVYNEWRSQYWEHRAKDFLEKHK